MVIISVDAIPYILGMLGLLAVLATCVAVRHTRNKNK